MLSSPCAAVGGSNTTLAICYNNRALGGIRFDDNNVCLHAVKTAIKCVDTSPCVSPPIYLDWSHGVIFSWFFKLFGKHFPLEYRSYDNIRLTEYAQTTFALPFWFQSVRNITPINSGVYLIPYLLPQIVALVVVGALVKFTGHYVPFMLLGELVCIVGTSMLTQLSATTTTVKWAAYLVTTGLGMGIAMQLPYTAVQVTLS
jgi:hypothetical protein